MRLPLRPRGGALPTLPPAHVTTGTIATYFPNVDMEAAAAGRFRSRYWEGLHDALCAAAARTPVRWLFIRFPSPQMDLAGCIRMRDRLRAARQDGVSFHYLEEFLTTADLRAAWKRYLRLAWTSRRLEASMRELCRFEGSRLNFWAYMAEDWAETFRGWRCLERCLQQRGIDNYVKAAGPQRWFTFPLENCPWERMLTHAAHTTPGAGGPVYGAQHSTIRPTDFRYFDDPVTFTDSACAPFQPDRICANGQGALRQWPAAGVPQERLELVEALRSVPGLALIAEDLGDLDADALRFIADSGLPGMKVLVYAFDPAGESAYLPHNCPRDAVIYTGTHDTPTFVQWLFEQAAPAERDYAFDYLRLREDEGFGWGAVCGAWMSPCRLAIAPMQDLLGLGGDARVNTPGTAGPRNWSWRVRQEALNPSVSGRLAHITRTYRR